MVRDSLIDIHYTTRDLMSLTGIIIQKHNTNPATRPAIMTSFENHYDVLSIPSLVLQFVQVTQSIPARLKKDTQPLYSARGIEQKISSDT
ncbi:hypothetical protein AWENTII_009922 [Aspergillus wentii]